MKLSRLSVSELKDRETLAIEWSNAMKTIGGAWRADLDAVEQFIAYYGSLFAEARRRELIDCSSHREIQEIRHRGEGIVAIRRTALALDRINAAGGAA